MTDPEILAEVWRGGRIESLHRGHAVIATPEGSIEAAWGDPERIIYPRSACKMIQALPLVESGAAAAAGLGPEELALACASHNGAAIHTDRVRAWLERLGLEEADLRCGPQRPNDRLAREALQAEGRLPDQTYNNCSGKHAGFLTLAKHLGGGPEYIDPDHPAQRAVRAAFEEMVGEASPGFGTDGCSAPNFACSMKGLARAAARMADPSSLPARRRQAATDLVAAMAAHPLLVAGEGRACSELIAASDGAAVVKTGAEGVFVGIFPTRGLGLALKIEDGATRGAEAAVAALLVRLGILAAEHPMVQKRMRAPVLNRRNILTGHVVAAPGLSG